jgi:uncharacterized membrane protein YccC
MSVMVSKSSWDRSAPLTYLFIIGLVLGFYLGFAVGVVNPSGASRSIALVLPAAAIVIAFIVLAVISRRIGRRV